MLVPPDPALIYRLSTDPVMHPVVTAPQQPQPPFPLAKLQLPHPPHPLPKPQQKLDWATECQTPLTASDDTQQPPTKDTASPSPASDDGPDQPSTPPTRRPSVAPQKPPFSPSPLLLASNGSNERLSSALRWRFGADEHGLADELIKMQIRDVPPNKITEPEDTHASPLETSPDPSSIREPSFAIHPCLAAAHSRASSGDTSSSESSSAQLQINTSVATALGSKPYTAAPGTRPRSFQEGLSITDAERKRLQMLTPVMLQGIDSGQGPKTSPPREPQHFHSPEVAPTSGGPHQTRYPSLQDQPQSAQPQSAPTYPSIQQQQAQQQQQQAQQQQAQHLHLQGHRPPPIHVAPGGADFRMNRPDDDYTQSRLSNPAQFAPPSRAVTEGPTYRQPGPRGSQYAHAPMQMGGPTSILPPGPGYAYAHPHPSPHLPLGPPTPQMYELPLPASPFRAAHQHSASDPAAGIREQNAALALMAGQMGAHLPPMHPFSVNGLNVRGSPLPHAAVLYNQFYPGGGVQVPVPDGYPGIPRMAQPGPYQQNGAPTPTAGSYGSGGSVPGSGGSQNGSTGQLASGGPSANNRKLGLYKTELCRSWEEKGSCRYGPKCQFAHGEDEIRKVARHPKVRVSLYVPERLLRPLLFAIAVQNRDLQGESFIFMVSPRS